MHLAGQIIDLPAQAFSGRGPDRVADRDCFNCRVVRITPIIYNCRTDPYTDCNLVPIGRQVFNFYGPRDNAFLLGHYGFALPDNRFDAVAIAVADAAGEARHMALAFVIKSVCTDSQRESNILVITCTAGAVTHPGHQ